jgi:hypothetical protein
MQRSGIFSDGILNLKKNNVNMFPSNYRRAKGRNGVRHSGTNPKPLVSFCLKAIVLESRHVRGLVCINSFCAYSLCWESLE